MPPRFFVADSLQEGNTLTLPEQAAHHAVRVLRLRVGDALVFFNGQGGEYSARLTRIERGQVCAELLHFSATERESPLQLTLIQALVAPEKLDWIVEKAVELGVHRLLLIPTERSVVRLSEERMAKRLAHLQQITVAACCQCGRNRLPEIAMATSLAQALTDSKLPAQRLWLSPSATSSTTLHLEGSTAIALAVGPEGGFTAAETALAEKASFVCTQWGPRVLRTETAGLAALAALQFKYGDLQGGS